MKPLCLTIKAFGPYAGKETINFADLKGRSFFLIHGPTGSGKTTILDAICFALYGDCSGSIRDSKAMRSDYAAAEEMTTIEFKFALGHDLYRIIRTPEQMRPKKRGDGLTVMLAEAELYQLGGSEAKLLVSGWSKVTEQVEALLGFKSNQFRQVVLLPQGEFRRLLTANSAERQEIMQALFKTDFYRQIEETLKGKAQTIKKEYDELSREKSWLLKEAGAEQPDELALRLKECEKEQAEAGLTLKAAAGNLKEAQNSLTEGKRSEEKLMEKAKAEAELAALLEKAPLVEEKREELKKAKQASTVFDVESMLKQLMEDCRQAEEAVQKEAAALQNAKAVHAKAKVVLESEQNKEAEREKAAAKVLYLTELGGKLDALTKAESDLNAQKQALAQAEREYREVQKSREKLKTEIENRSADSQRLMENAMREEVYQARLSEVFKQTERVYEYKKVKEQWIKAQARLKEAQTASEMLTTRCIAAKAAFTALQEVWFSGQAAVMAAKLSAGAPCPVCGSTEHPKPAGYREALPDEEKVKAQQKNVELMEKEREEGLKDLGRLQTEQDTLANRVYDLELELGEAAQSSIETLEETKAKAESEYQSALADKKQLISIKEVLDKLGAEEAELNKLEEQRAVVLQTLSARFQAASAIKEERKAQVPEEFQETAVLSAAQREANLVLNKLKAAFEKAQKELELADRQRIKSQAVAENTRENLDKLKGKLILQQTIFAERLSEAGFLDEAAYQNAKKPPAYIEKLAERIAVFEENFITAKERARLTEEAAKDVALPDLAALDNAVTLAQKSYEEVLAEDTRLRTQAAQIAVWQDKLRSLAEKGHKIEQEYAVIGRLAEVANGGNEYKLTFQRFVLGALLDDVAYAANQRLLIMSRGRYKLERTMDRARKNAAGGLDLEVFDSHTGVSRGIGTLSGGEMFLASLSLALGLADVVQSYAGGMRLDTILVDEGFGTLDPETLDIALKALLDLQKGGRLVGIISHVPELKERIDARLEISLTDKGSRAQFKVG